MDLIKPNGIELVSMPTQLPHTPMEICRFSGSKPGPHLLVLGAVHGNETCGPIAIRQILDALSREEIRIISGRVTFIPVANPDAFTLRQRAAVRDLNRNFGPVAKPAPGADFFVNTLCETMRDCDVLLDIHSFKAQGSPFLYVGPERPTALEPFDLSAEELNFAKALGVQRMVFGWLAAYDRFVTEQEALIKRLGPGKVEQADIARHNFGIGTTEYFRSLGRRYGVTAECGNHLDETAIATAREAILSAMAFLGLTEDTGRNVSCGFAESYRFERIFVREDMEDRLARPFSSFDQVRAGETIGLRKNGTPVVAPADGAVIFSYADTPVGTEWIYFASESQRGCK
jgi:predicted deacylase